MGHYERTKNLMEEIGQDSIYLVSNQSTLLKTKLKNNLIFINDEIKCLIKNTKKYQPKAIIYDLLDYSKINFEQIKTKLKIPIIAFHEINGAFNNSILNINYNTFTGWEKMQKSGLFGPKYIIFNANIKQAKKPIESSLFVSFGGSDPNNIMKWFIQNILPKLVFNKIILHFGPFSDYKNDFKNLESSNLEIVRAPDNLHSISEKCSTALVAGGNTMYEMVFQGLTTFVIAQNNHQEEFAKNADRHRLLKYLGKQSDLRKEDVIFNLNRRFSFNTDKLIDGMGKSRIVKKIKELI
tara:strand:- start:1978 stop:2862 length:885 start_codon:yes stop_codon:yes gene_type:complete